MGSAMRERDAALFNDSNNGVGLLSPITVSETADEHLYALARAFTASRRRLTTHLDPSLFANPGLDILLFLFAEGVDGRTVTTNACCAAAGVPRTTALRWVKLLQDRGLIDGSDDVSDRRVTMLALSDRAREIIRAWLTDITVMPLTNPNLDDR